MIGRVLAGRAFDSTECILIGVIPHGLNPETPENAPTSRFPDFGTEEHMVTRSAAPSKSSVI